MADTTTNRFNDLTFYCNVGMNVGVPRASGRISGEPLNRTFFCEPMSGRASVSGNAAPGVVFLCEALRASASILGSVAFDDTPNNWVMWSKIGSADFTLDRVNDAGRRPMSWKGIVYQMRTMHIPTANGVRVLIVVYGDGGVSLLSPVSEPAPTFSYRRISSLGVRGRGLVAGTQSRHYFVDSRGDLNTVSNETLGTDQGVKVLGYAKYLETLDVNYAVMHYDDLNDLLHICDGVRGFTLSKQGLGGGPKNLTGLETDGQDLLAMSNAEIAIDQIYVETNLTDCGIRSPKPLQMITISATDPQKLEFSVGHRNRINDPLTYTTWRALNKYGEGFITITGLEFTIRVRGVDLTSQQIDDIVLHLRVPGTIQDRSPIK